MNRRTGFLFDRPNWLAFSITASLIFLIYLSTISPEVTLEWAGMLATGGNYCSAPSPPGYPVWTLYAQLFAKLLPFDNVAHRIAIGSAFAGALSCGVIALIVSHTVPFCLRGIRFLKRLDPGREQYVRVVCGCVAGIGFGLDTIFWKHAVIVETSTLAALLLALSILLAIRWSQCVQSRLYLYAAAFVYGLSLGVHISFALLAPAMLLFVYFRDRELGRDLLFLSTIVLALILGLNARNQLPDWAYDILEIPRGMTVVYSWIAVFSAAVCARGAFVSRRLGTRWQEALVVATAAVIPLLSYLYIPVVSMSTPPDNWSYPRMVEGFFHLIGRGQFERISPIQSLSYFAWQLRNYGTHSVESFGPLYVVAALLYVSLTPWMRVRQRRFVFGLLGILVSATFVTTALLNPSVNRLSWELIAQYFVPSHLILAILSGYGLGAIATFVSQTRESAVE